jgi:hypothetical protein
MTTSSGVILQVFMMSTYAVAGFTLPSPAAVQLASEADHVVFVALVEPVDRVP